MKKVRGVTPDYEKILVPTPRTNNNMDDFIKKSI